MRERFNKWFHHYMGRDALWNRVDLMLFGKIVIFSFRREVNGLRWIFSLFKIPVLWGARAQGSPNRES